MFHKLKNKLLRFKQLSSQFQKNLYFIATNDLNDKFYETKDGAVEDSFYEFEENKEYLKRLKILSQDDSLKKLEENPKSFVRFGDSEISIMSGEDGLFQSFNPLLRDKLLTILSSESDDYYIGINGSYFKSAFGFIERNHRFYREHGTKFRRFFVNHCNYNIEYLDACCFGAYLRYEDSFDYKAHYERLRNLVRGKNIALVAGEGIIEKLKYDFFDCAASAIRINAPRLNAFDVYDELYNTVLSKVPKDYLVCIILGQTATVLAADLAHQGYTAWDLGHIAKEYDAYKCGMAKSQNNLDKFWAPD